MATQELKRLKTQAARVSRRETRIITSSENPIIVPSWFDYARDMLLASGCGGGGGSAPSNGSFYGMAGGSGAQALGHPVVLWPGVTHMRATIGAGGAGGGIGDSFGGGGGSVTLQAYDSTYTTIFTLGGGNGGAAGTNANGTNGSGGSYSMFGLGDGPSSMLLPDANAALTPSLIAKITRAALNAQVPTMRRGVGARRTANSNTMVPQVVSEGVVPRSLFNPSSSPSNGYGYGGRRVSTLTATAGNPGGPGVLVLEFIEGLTP